MRFDPLKRAFALPLLLIAAAAVLTLPEPTIGDAEFQAYEARCEQLAHKADGNLAKEDFWQMVEDCMDDGGPIEGLSVR